MFTFAIAQLGVVVKERVGEQRESGHKYGRNRGVRVQSPYYSISDSSLLFESSLTRGMDRKIDQLGLLFHVYLR